MFLWHIFATHSLIIIIFLLIAPSPSGALPVNPLPLDGPAKAGECDNSKTGPCICGNVLPIRDKYLRDRCGHSSTKFYFDPNTLNGGMRPSPTTEGDLHCVHIVDLTWLASQVDEADPALCEALLEEGGHKYQALRQHLNSHPNVHLLEAVAASTFTSLLAGKQLRVTWHNLKFLRASVNFLEFLIYSERYPGITTAAEGLGNFIEELIPGVNVLSGGTEGFVERYQTKFTEVVGRGKGFLKPHEHITNPP